MIISFILQGRYPRQLVEWLAQGGIFVWDGDSYCVVVTEQLGVEEKGDGVRPSSTLQHARGDPQEKGGFGS